MTDLEALILRLIKLPAETEWLEFKRSNDNPEEIGEYISALSNSAAYHERNDAYIIWGIDDKTHEIVGTTFDYRTLKVKGQELENWLRQLLSENAIFQFYTITLKEKKVVLCLISKAMFATVKFKGEEYIRVGSYKKKLKDFPVMEGQLWSRINNDRFEKMLAKQDLSPLAVLQSLDYGSYFELIHIPLPNSTEAIIHYLAEEEMIINQDNGLFAITNLGAILFAKNIELFNTISRKSIRVIQYEGNKRTATIRETDGRKGYASGFQGLLQYIEGLLPAKENIKDGLRNAGTLYPQIALRELIINALIHQDFSISGTGPMVEIFNNRIEITNPGIPLVDAKRFIDNPPISRNEMIASLMRRANLCEERGSGWDKVAALCEVYQLPAPKIEIYEKHTKVILFSYIKFGNLTSEEKKWSCYMHACLKQVSGEQMTNASLRERFGVPESNKSAISRLIAATIKAKLIKALDPDAGPKYRSYVPFWA